MERAETVDLEHPGWMLDAACRGAPIGVFFPEGKFDVVTDEAWAICGRCRVSTDCLAYAQTWASALLGVWSATNPTERRRLRRGPRSRRRAA